MDKIRSWSDKASLLSTINHSNGVLSTEAYRIWRWERAIMMMVIVVMAMVMITLWRDAIYWCWSSTKGPKTCQENTPTPLHHHQRWYQEGWIHDFMLTMSHSDPNSKINTCQRQHCFNLQLSNFSESVRIVHTFLFSTVAPSVVFYCYSPPSSRFNVLCLQPWRSASSFWTDLCKH